MGRSHKHQVNTDTCEQAHSQGIWPNPRPTMAAVSNWPCGGLRGGSRTNKAASARPAIYTHFKAGSVGRGIRGLSHTYRSKLTPSPVYDNTVLAGRCRLILPGFDVPQGGSVIWRGMVVAVWGVQRWAGHSPVQHCHRARGLSASQQYQLLNQL